MLFHQNVKQFIDDHHHAPLSACHFFYKDTTGCYIDADQSTAYRAGVERCEIVGKNDAQLKWHNFYHEYRINDTAVMDSQQSKVLIETTTCNLNKTTQILSAKHPVISNKGTGISGIFGMVVYIEEVNPCDVANYFNYLNRVMPTKDCSALLTTHSYDKLSKVSPREAQCAKYLCQGYTAREIATLLCLSVRTVESHIASLKNKLNVSKKSDLIRLWLSQR